MELEEQTLDALLAFVDGFEDTTDTQSETSESVSVSVPCSVEVSERKRKRSEEKRPKEAAKDELARLRQEMESLRDAFETLKTKVVNMHGRVAYERRLQLLGNRKDVVKAWKRIADRQLDRRRASEAENERLRRRVAKQRKAMVGLQRIIRHHLIEAMNQAPPMNSMALPTWSLTSEADGSYSIMENLGDLMIDMKEANKCTQAWLRFAHSLRSSGEDSHVLVKPLAPHQLVVELVDVRVFPFDFSAVGDACWVIGVNTLCRAYDLVRQETDVDGRATVFSVQSVRGTIDAEGTQEMHMRRLTFVQRVNEQDRSVILHVGRTQSIEFGGVEMKGMSLTAQHWNIFQQLDTADSCTMTSSARFTIQVDHGHSISKELCVALTSYFADSMTRDMEVVSTRLEDYLLECGLRPVCSSV
ncbi:hypothetical protein Poli38472_007137 [Pythium oligandrum]|uniref:Uncharacterized protein n=1 Tax=Pythium oligandrum TaxID=41045 RepID=A0A8K1CAQ5_PYTOL|nr:hypothetical protein Poli38472_007137 [Pythium oligandrum]|eukprot:TMW58992.1 hypothetical protein Poli38472_007137 [Pythium oligandrum]